jgi:hypothetical protein
LFRGGAGNKGLTLADAFSAITDFYSHESAGEDKSKQFVSSEFGDGARSKREGMAFLTECLDKSARGASIETGRKLVADFLAAK